MALGRGTRAAAALVVGIVAAAGRWLWRARPHVERTMGGLALVYTTRDDSGTPVRVLRTGGVYQSATYLGPRGMEPVFA